MPRPNAKDPLIPLPVRLPASTVERLRAQAEYQGCSVSDVLRAHLTLEGAKPLGKPKPRKRAPKKLGSVSEIDPTLAREIASIGNNINQIARVINQGLLNGSTMDSIKLLVVLQAIDQRITKAMRGSNAD